MARSSVIYNTDTYRNVQSLLKASSRFVLAAFRASGPRTTK
jgi:hypothetical protein